MPPLFFMFTKSTLKSSITSVAFIVVAIFLGFVDRSFWERGSRHFAHKFAASKPHLRSVGSSNTGRFRRQPSVAAAAACQVKPLPPPPPPSAAGRLFTPSLRL